MTDETYDFGEALIQGLEEALAWKRGEIALETVRISPMPPARVKAIRKKVAKTARAFEARFGIPAATISNWEQGRREPDLTARLLLRVIEHAPDVVEQVAREST
jgi:putative transcriptional regulator